jgi:hypothetical protein
MKSSSKQRSNFFEKNMDLNFSIKKKYESGIEKLLTIYELKK